MSKRGGGPKGQAGASSKRARRLLAVHSEVVKALIEWSRSKGHRSVAEKIHNFTVAILENDRETENTVYRQLAVTPIRGCSGLRELGPKQSRGGAARVFVYEKGSVVFLVAAEVEKSSSGAGIDRAKSRVKEIEKAMKNVQVGELAAAVAAAGSYKVSTIGGGK